MQPVDRRSALRFGALGAALAMGHPVLMASAAAQTTTVNDGPPAWTLTADIPGCPKTSANICSFEIADLDLVRGTSENAPAKAVLSAIALADVRAEIEAWFESARRNGGAKTMKIVLAQPDGSSRGFVLGGVVPLDVSAPQMSTSQSLQCYAVDLLVDAIVLL